MLCCIVLYCVVCHCIASCRMELLACSVYKGLEASGGDVHLYVCHMAAFCSSRAVSRLCSLWSIEICLHVKYKINGFVEFLCAGAVALGVFLLHQQPVQRGVMTSLLDE